MRSLQYASRRDSRPPPGAFCTCFYDHARRLRLEKLLCVYIELSRSSSGYFKPLLDPDGGFTSETAVRWIQKRNGRYVTVSELKRLQIYNGHMPVALIRVGPPGYFTQISITTPVVSALKNYNIQSFLGVLTDF